MKSGKKTVTKAPDMIQLHFEAEPGETPVEDTVSTASYKPESVSEDSSTAIGWGVLSLRLRTPAGYEMYTKWFDDKKCMKPIFSKISSTHTITRSQLMLLLTRGSYEDNKDKLR